MNLDDTRNQQNNSLGKGRVSLPINMLQMQQQRVTTSKNKIIQGDDERQDGSQSKISEYPKFDITAARQN